MRSSGYIARGLLVLALLLAGGGRLAALEIEFSGRLVKRDILALYDSRHESAPQETRIHKFAEVALNHLGYRVTYLDVNGPLPKPAELAAYRGLLTWFIEPMKRADTYVAWLDRATAAGLRYVFFSELAPAEPTGAPGADVAIKRIYARLGLEPTNQFISITTAAKIVKLNPDMVGFERPVDKVIPDFPVNLALPGRCQVHLGVETPTRLGVKTAVLVATSPGGGYVSDELTTFYEPNTDKVRWIVNPFAFFKEAFGEDRFPIPDVTTLSGRRMYFSHIDGDGWNNVSEIEQYREQQMISAEVIAKEAIEAFPDLPVTVGLIVGDVDPELGGLTSSADVARRLYAMPQVEVGSHTYSHPFTWSFFEHYSRAEEQKLIDGVSRPGLPMVARARAIITDLAGKPQPVDPSNRYIAGSSDLPRTYLKLPFDLDKEVSGAIAATEALAPPGKKLKLYQWSGDTTPFEAAIHATRVAGVRNMNGGDARLDTEYPSVFYLPPIARPVGKERQIYSGNSNENTYTNDWTGPYYGFFLLERTLNATETPRRLKPFNLYYHMYSGERASALAAIKHFLTLARNSDVIPVEASRYAAIADDFFGVEVQQVDLFAWAIEKRGALQTVRFDDAAELTIDYGHSTGVLGATSHVGALYVSLDPAVERPVVALRARAGEAERDPAAPVASLVSARWQLSGRQSEPCKLRAIARGYGPGDMTWRARPGQGLRVTFERGSRVLGQQVVWAAADGTFKIRAPESGLEPMDVRIECHD